MGISGNSDEVAVLIDETVDGLSDPKRSVGGELEPLTAIEFFYGMF